MKHQLSDLKADTTNIEQMLDDIRADIDHQRDMPLEIQNVLAEMESETFRKQNNLFEY